jgi:hypothetical protein
VSARLQSVRGGTPCLGRSRGALPLPPRVGECCKEPQAGDARREKRRERGSTRAVGTTSAERAGYDDGGRLKEERAAVRQAFGDECVKRPDMASGRAGLGVGGLDRSALKTPGKTLAELVAGSRAPRGAEARSPGHLLRQKFSRPGSAPRFSSGSRNRKVDETWGSLLGSLVPWPAGGEGEPLFPPGLHVRSLPDRAARETRLGLGEILALSPSPSAVLRHDEHCRDLAYADEVLWRHAGERNRTCRRRLTIMVECIYRYPLPRGGQGCVMAQ